MPKQITQPKKSAAAKATAAKRTRNDKGHFQSGPVLPPSADVNFSSMFAALPNPVNGVFYDPDVAFRSNPENALRMLFDPDIFSALQERQLATALLPWSIVPQDEDDPRQQYAAKCLTEILEQTPDLVELFRSLLDAIWFGRAAAYMDYSWDYTTGRRRMVISRWTPVHSNSLLFDKDGLAGYKVGVGNDKSKEFITVEGRGERITEQERGNWLVHSYQKVAGEWRNNFSAAAIFGYGLISRLYPSWLWKQTLYQSLASWNEKFANGFTIYYFEMGNDASYEAMKAAAENQMESCAKLIPRQAGEDAPEGIEVIDPPAGAETALKLIDNLKEGHRLTIYGQELTAGSSNGSTLGGTLGESHERTASRYTKYDSLALQESISKELLPQLQHWNGFGDCPPLKFEFSHEDLGDKLENAQILKNLGINVDTNDLVQMAGFKVPVAGEDDGPQWQDTGDQEDDDNTNTDSKDDATDKADKSGDSDKIAKFSKAKLKTFNTKDDAGHVHDSKDGKFTSTGGGSSGKEPPASKPHKQSNSEHHEQARKDLHSTLAPVIKHDPELAKKYQAHVDHVINRMSPEGAKRLSANVSAVRWHKSIAGVTASARKLFESRGKSIGDNAVVGGLYSARDKHLLLDGGLKDEDHENLGTQSAREIYAHEFGHAIDAPAGAEWKDRISATPEWSDAFDSELSGGQLTKYGASSKIEGWAEFARLAILKPEIAKDKLPKCWAVWDKHGLA